MFLNDIRNIFDIPWNDELTYGEVRRVEEVEHSDYSFNEADVELLQLQFGQWEQEAERLLDRVHKAPEGALAAPLILPAYESVLKCSHLFNVLDARGAFSVTERAANIQRIRRVACRCAEAYLAARREAGFPLLAATGATS
jgi:glycyl-tRNA synthetase alpha chain